MSTITLESLDGKSQQRLRKIRDRHRELKYSSHAGGAGGVRDSELFQHYAAIVRKCDLLLHTPYNAL
jgi:hypothetical protein